MSKINHTEFFKQTPQSVTAKKVQKPDNKNNVSDKPEAVFINEKSVRPKVSVPICIDDRITSLLRETINLLTAEHQNAVAKQIDNIYKDAVRNRFSVAVVGEFSRGKSTFINAFLENDFLPVGDLPTTAMLTRIRYNSKEMLVIFDRNGKKVKNLPLNECERFTAENFTGRDPMGTILAGVNHNWLYENNVEIIDTPGAGDLEEKRTKLIGDALLGSDGAIITISASQALSMSEKLFIEQRILSRKTPFIMMIVTKLDDVPQEQREKVMNYIFQKLKAWGMNIPMFIPYQTEIGSEHYADIMGMDKIRDEIVSWINAPERVKLTEDWIIARTLSVLNELISSLQEQKLLLSADSDKQEKLIQQKKQKLSQAVLAWGDIKLKMMERCNECYSLMLEKADDYKNSITERLQYEASHSNSPQKWWNEDYPYRLKIELTNMSVSIENTVSRRVSEDAKWFNDALEKSFQTHVLFKKDTISDKEMFKQFSAGNNLEFEDLGKQRNMVRVGTTVLSIAGSAICMSVGFMPLIATMGVGTGVGLISEKIFKNKIEKQQADIKAAIAKAVPTIIDDAMSGSEKRLKAVYEDMIRSAAEKEKTWMSSQENVIEKSAMASGNTEQAARLDKQLKQFQDVYTKFQTI